MRKAQDVAAAGTGEAAGPCDEQKAQRPDAAEDIGIGAFARARLGQRAGVELEGTRDVVGQNAELLPGTVGAVVVRRHHVERELALELSERFLLGPAATNEGVQGG